MTGQSQVVGLTCERIEQALIRSPAFRKVERHFYVVRQGSAYVTLHVLPWREGAAVIRLVAQLARDVEMTPDLALRLLRANTRLRFGSFGWEKANSCVTLQHTLVAEPGLDDEDLLAALREIALVADEYDDLVVNEAGGRTMQSLLEEHELDALRRAVEARWEDPQRR